MEKIFTMKKTQRRLVKKIESNDPALNCFIVQGVFLHWASPKKLKYVKPRLGESMFTQIVLDTPNLA